MRGSHRIARLARGREASNGLVIRFKQLENREQVGDFQDAATSIGRTYKFQVTAAPTEADKLFDQGAEAAAVHVRHVMDVENHIDSPLGNQRVDPVPEWNVTFVEYQSSSEGQDGDVANSPL